ncbi:hypothetical protein GCK32_004213, partial [Trichostrongylus colubriformis]
KSKYKSNYKEKYKGVTESVEEQPYTEFEIVDAIVRPATSRSHGNRSAETVEEREKDHLRALAATIEKSPSASKEPIASKELSHESTSLPSKERALDDHTPDDEDDEAVTQDADENHHQSVISKETVTLEVQNELKQNQSAKPGEEKVKNTMIPV